MQLIVQPYRHTINIYMNLPIRLCNTVIMLALTPWQPEVPLNGFPCQRWHNFSTMHWQLMIYKLTFRRHNSFLFSMHPTQVQLEEVFGRDKTGSCLSGYTPYSHYENHFMMNMAVVLDLDKPNTERNVKRADFPLL